MKTQCEKDGKRILILSHYATTLKLDLENLQKQRKRRASDLSEKDRKLNNLFSDGCEKVTEKVSLESAVSETMKGEFEVAISDLQRQNQEFVEKFKDDISVLRKKLFSSAKKQYIIIFFST